MRTRSRRRPLDPRESADRELAARLSELEDKVAAASTALREAAMSETSAEVIRRRYREVTEAHDAVIAAADAGYRLAVGPTDGVPHTRLIAARARPAAVTWRHLSQQLRLGRQQHLLAGSPTWGGPVPGCERAAALAAAGPFWPQTDYLPEEVVYHQFAMR